MPEIGTTLREARMRAHISIDEVETRTKIRAKYLRAIENEEWDLLPGSVYAKSFVRTYGDFLGLDSRMLVDEFRRRYEHPTDHDLRPIGSLSRERERSARGPADPAVAGDRGRAGGDRRRPLLHRHPRRHEEDTASDRHAGDPDATSPSIIVTTRPRSRRRSTCNSSPPARCTCASSTPPARS